MKKNKTILIIMLAVLIFGGWQLYRHLAGNNSDLRLRAIPDNSDILKTMQELSANSSDYRKYAQSLKELCDSNPVTRQIIIDNLTLASIYDPEKITITEELPKTSGEFTIRAYTISAIGITPQQLSLIIDLAQNISVATPNINISNTNKIMATVTIFGLEYSKE